MIGVFQGCTISTILFNTAFNTIFGHMKELEASHGYLFKGKHQKVCRIFVSGWGITLGKLQLSSTTRH
jgi:hypothetical protein